MYEILDFDANFAAYTEKWIQMNKSKFKNIEQMEDAMPEVYMHWLNSPAAFLMGETPALYFAKYNDAHELLHWASEYENAGVPVPDPLIERISDIGESAVPALISAAADRDNTLNMRIMAMNLLKETDEKGECVDLCLGIIDRREVDDEPADVAAELLQTVGGNCADIILERFDDVCEAAQETYLDILSNYPENERVFELMLEAFELHTEKSALYASLLGKLNDDRAIEPLTRALERSEINYLDYLEIKNSIEMLGGVVSTEREFAGDPYYETLKGE